MCCVVDCLVFDVTKRMGYIVNRSFHFLFHKHIAKTLCVTAKIQ